MALASIIILLVSFNLVPPDNLAPIAFGPILLALMLMWYRQIKPASRQLVPVKQQSLTCSETRDER